jgi:hypothetical protein
MTTPMEQGHWVRLIHDVARFVVTTGQSRPNGSNPLIGVSFATGIQFVPSDQIEPLPQAVESPVSLLKDMRLSESSRLRQVLTHIRLTGRLRSFYPSRS